MNRLEYFKLKCSEHILYKRLALRLSEDEFDVAVQFIEDNDHLDYLEFEYKLNMMFDGKPKPKRWSIIQELVLVANGCKAL
jgi:hypothetical protein